MLNYCISQLYFFFRLTNFFLCHNLTLAFFVPPEFDIHSRFGAVFVSMSHMWQVFMCFCMEMGKNKIVISHKPFYRPWILENLIKARRNRAVKALEEQINIQFTETIRLMRAEVVFKSEMFCCQVQLNQHLTQISKLVSIHVSPLCVSVVKNRQPIRSAPHQLP